MDFISLTDMARKLGDDSLIYSWMRKRNSIEFIGIWEQIHIPDFKGIEFETFRKLARIDIALDANARKRVAKGGTGEDRSKRG